MPPCLLPPRLPRRPWSMPRSGPPLAADEDTRLAPNAAARHNLARRHDPGPCRAVHLRGLLQLPARRRPARPPRPRPARPQRRHHRPRRARRLLGLARLARPLLLAPIHRCARSAYIERFFNLMQRIHPADRRRRLRAVHRHRQCRQSAAPSRKPPHAQALCPFSLTSVECPRRGFAPGPLHPAKDGPANPSRPPRQRLRGTGRPHRHHRGPRRRERRPAPSTMPASCAGNAA
jgi:hypothetical protein